jgi:hypothetical protein
MALEATATYSTNSLRRYVNLEEELKKVYIGQYKKRQKKITDATANGAKTLDRNHFSRIRVSEYENERGKARERNTSFPSHPAWSNVLLESSFFLRFLVVLVDFFFLRSIGILYGGCVKSAAKEMDI